MKQANRIDINGFIIEPVIVDDGAVDVDNLIATQCPNGFHKPKWDRVAWVEGKPQADILVDVKSAKIAELEQKRNETLNGGFKSSATGTLYTYSSDQVAQANFDGEFAFLNSAVSTDTTVDWYTWESGMVTHTKAQFNQLYTDGRAFKKSAWTKYATLEAQAKAATTVAAVNAIVW